MIQVTELANGAKIITEVVDEVYSASIGVWVDVGSESESISNNGVSHCLEHMLFKGTRSRTAQDIAQQIEDVGGSLGASTGKENTCFYGRVLGGELPVAIDLLFDMLLNPTLAPEDLEVERQVILEEIKMYEDDPEDFAHEQLILNIWPDHPLSRPITGTTDTVSGITTEMLRHHTHMYYQPDKLVVSIAGKFDEKAALLQIEQLLNGKNRGLPKPINEPPTQRQFSVVKHKDVEQAQISLAGAALTVADHRRYILAVLDLCLGGNVSSRLFQEIREKRGLVYAINTFRESHRYCGLFGVYAGASPKQVPTVVELISQEFVRTKQDGFTDQEIARAKVQLKSELLLSLESMRTRSTRNAYNQMYFGRQATVAEICADIDRVTKEQVTHLANELLLPELFGTVIVGPVAELEGNYSLNF